MAVLWRGAALALVGLALALPCQPAQAQWQPAKPIKFIVPFGPGGSGDTLARLIGHHLSERIGQPVVAENRMGAGGNIGADVVAKSDPDGTTLLMGANYVAISPSMYKKMSYDPAKDLAPVTNIGSIPMVLVVNNAVPAQSVAELVDAHQIQARRIHLRAAGARHVHSSCVGTVQAAGRHRHAAGALPGQSARHDRCDRQDKCRYSSIS